MTDTQALILMLTVVLCVMLGLSAKILAAGRKRSYEKEAEEARLMQELNHSFQKLEERVESLETIMLETGSMRRDSQTASPKRQAE